MEWFFRITQTLLLVIKLNVYKENGFDLFPGPHHDYTPVHFAFGTLANRRYEANISFLSNLLTKKVNCPNVLSLINFSILTCNTRSPS